MSDVLEAIEQYYDAVPRTGAEVEELGPFTLFVAKTGWPYYARPSRVHVGPRATGADVLAVRRRQQELGVPEAIEWVDDVTPGLVDAAADAGMTVEQLPLLVLDAALTVDPPPGISIRLVEADDPDLARIEATVHLGFASHGTAVGPVGVAEWNASAVSSDPTTFEHRRSRLRAGLTAMIAAYDDAGPLAAGSHQPVGSVTEIVGVASLPSARRRGLAAAVTAALVADARHRGVQTVFLSAGSDDVARVYERAGFRRIATACTASAD